MATLAQLKTRYPELSGSDAYLQAVLDDATLDVSVQVFGADTERAILALAAHYAVGTSGINAGAGAVQSVSAGSASVTYAAGAYSRSDFNSTGYGAEYARLLNRNVGSMQLVAP